MNTRPEWAVKPWMRCGDGLPLPPDVQVQGCTWYREALSNARKQRGVRPTCRCWCERPPLALFGSGRLAPGSNVNEIRAESQRRAQRSLRERRRPQVGGSVDIDSAPGTGTTVTPDPAPNPVALAR